MLESFRKGQRWLTLIFVSTIGLVFVFFLGVGGSFGPRNPTGNAIVQLDELRLTQRDFGRERNAAETRMREQLGEAYEQLGASQYVDTQALGNLINKVVLAEAAEQMGLQVTRDEVRRFVRDSPAFVDEEGRFSPEAFDRFASYEYGSQRAFIETFSREILGQKLVQLLVGHTTVSDAELDLRARYDLEEARIAYVAIDAATLQAEVELEENEVEDWAAENDEALRALYAEREAELAEPERVRARHLLVLAAPDASDEEQAAAREKAAAARERIVGGEDFAAVAKEISEDVATRETGGELGVFARGSNDPAVDEAAFALEAGALSDVVRSAYGFHVIQVDEKLAAEIPTFESQRLALAEDAARQARAQARADALADQLASAIREGLSLEDAASAAEIALERPPGLRRRPDGFVPGLGEAGPILTAAFSLAPGTTSPEIFDIDGRRIMIQVLERSGPDAPTLANERAARREKVLLDKQNAAIQSWVQERRRSLEDAGRLLVNAELALGT